MSPLTVREIMTSNLVSVRDDASLSNIDWEMTLAEIRHVPVVDGAGHVVGIVSDRDLLRSLHRTERHRVPVSAIMTLTPMTVRPETLARDALESLMSRKVSAMPVVDDQGHLCGIVTATDFLDLAYRALRGLDVDAPRVEA